MEVYIHVWDNGQIAITNNDCELNELKIMLSG